jgi:hypothetical protein
LRNVEVDMHVEVAERLFVGDQNSSGVREAVDGSWSVVHACKEPFHRTFAGYPAGKAAPAGPEYLVAARGERLALNMIDAPVRGLVPLRLVEEFLAWAEPRWMGGRPVLIHCNQGRSRSPALALLVLARAGVLPSASLADAEAAFRSRYPAYEPGVGVRGFLEQHWSALAVR